MSLSISSLNIGYQQTRVVHDVSLTVSPGEIVAIVGPNGCGKSTLLKSIGRQLKPESGRIMLDKHDIWHTAPSAVARLLTLLPQQALAPEGITVEALVRHGRHPHQGLFRQWSDEDQLKLEQALADTDVLSLRGRPLNELSGGQRQRAWLAMCLAQDTPYVLLDEPTSALDLGHQVEVLNLIHNLSRQGKAFLIVLHDLLSAVRYADRIIAMKSGSIVDQGNPDQVISEDLLQTLYGIKCDIVPAPHDGVPLIVPRRQ